MEETLRMQRLNSINSLQANRYNRFQGESLVPICKNVLQALS